LSSRKKAFKKTVGAEEGRRRREETTLQIRKTKKGARLAKQRQLQGSGLSAPTPAGMAAASMPKQEEKEEDNKAKREAQKQETKKDSDTKDGSDEQAKKKNDTPVDTKSDQRPNPRSRQTNKTVGINNRDLFNLGCNGNEHTSRY
jgi:hypothetical protein